MTGCRLAILIPARDEADRLAACLDALLAQDGGERLRIVVAANGCRDATVHLAEDRAAALRALGHEVLVLDLPEPGKPAALNAADRHADGCRVYLDADAALAPDAVSAVHRALHADPESPRLVSPRPRFTFPDPSRLTAGYYAVWSQLPAVRDQMIGGGCYAVNAAGRRRWQEFPPLIADDAFVRRQFAATEIELLDTEFTTAFPDRRRLVGVVRRWRAGNSELAAAGHGTPGAGALGNVAHIARRPSLWRHFPAFAYVLLLTRIQPQKNTGGDSGPAWTH